MKPFKWLHESVKGRDGKFSFQRITIFAFTAMFVVTWFFQLFFGYVLDSITLTVIAIVILVGWGILKAEHIVAILKRPDPNYYADDIYNTNRRTEELTDIDADDTTIQ